jgi:DNA repair protein RadC
MATFTIREKATGKKATRSSDIYKSLKMLSKADQEAFWVLGYDAQLFEIFRGCIHLGGVSEFHVDKKIVFKRILTAGASAWIAIHNHPSPTLKPSKADVDLAKYLQEASKLLDLRMLDFIIISDIGKGFYSFLEEGIFK